MFSFFKKKKPQQPQPTTQGNAAPTQSPGKTSTQSPPKNKQPTPSKNQAIHHQQILSNIAEEDVRKSSEISLE